MFTCWVLTGVFGAIVLLYGLLEVHYFLRMCFTVFFARFCKKRAHILDETSVHGTFVSLIPKRTVEAILISNGTIRIIVLLGILPR